MESTTLDKIRNSKLRTLLGGDGPFPFAFAQHTAMPVYSVDHVHLTVLSLNGTEVLLVTAFGSSSTSGWSNARLQPYIHIQPPTDNIWDFVFAAMPPSGISFDALTPISTTFVWPAPPQNLKGVRIHASINYLEHMITNERKNISEVKTNHVLWQKAA
jgi:hypothetical protein